MMGLLLALAIALPSASSVSGVVVDHLGAAVPSAEVYLEPDPGAALLATQTDADGRFRVEGDFAQRVGIFAVAPGKAYGGESLEVPWNDAISDVIIALPEPGRVSGKVHAGRRNKPIEGAEVTGILLMGERKVGIPLAKLAARGHPIPTTNASGAVTIEGVPLGTEIALKIRHASYAQDHVLGVRAGGNAFTLSLQPGITVHGTVRSRGAQLAIANARVTITNAHPPRDSVSTTTDHTGAFNLRLKPGAYWYEVESASMRTPGPEQLLVSGELSEEQKTLYVAGQGTITGKVIDAITNSPVAGATLSLHSFGKEVGYATTGHSGTYSFKAAAGTNAVSLLYAPGFKRAERKAYTLDLMEGEEQTFPDLFMTPLPTYRVHVLNQAGAPVPGAIVSLVRPRQFGWTATDADGWAELNVGSLPEDGSVVGLVEHAHQPLGAYFAISDSQVASAEVRVQTLSAIAGSTENAKGRSRAGVAVAAVFALSGVAEPIPFARTVSRDDGRFAWNSVPANIIVKALAMDTSGVTGKTVSMRIEPGTTANLGALQGELVEGRSAYGDKLPWFKGQHLGGDPVDAGFMADKAAVVMYCPNGQAAVVIEAFEEAAALIRDRGIEFGVVVDGPYEPGDVSVPIFAGEAPGAATTYVVNANGVVMLETFGMPPLRALQQVANALPLRAES
jgi:hypothetical protein